VALSRLTRRDLSRLRSNFTRGWDRPRAGCGGPDRRARPFVLTLLCFMGTLAGCVSLPAVTSGQIGCAEKDITILDDEQGFSTRTWTAVCDGKRYFCSGDGGGNNSTGGCRSSRSRRLRVPASAAGAATNRRHSPWGPQSPPKPKYRNGGNTNSAARRIGSLCPSNGVWGGGGEARY
jgi:hypothetical protein